jgi:hypothetical protein
MMYMSERNFKGSSNKRCDIIKYIEHMSIVHVPEFHNDNWQKKYFSRIISQDLIITSLFITKAILNPFSATFKG